MIAYSITTRPDIAFILQQLSQHISKPRIVHYKSDIRVL